jgi:hypothetical protein
VAPLSNHWKKYPTKNRIQISGALIHLRKGAVGAEALKVASGPERWIDDCAASGAFFAQSPFCHVPAKADMRVKKAPIRSPHRSALGPS